MPIAMSHDGSLDFSFSGLKTALVYAVASSAPTATRERRADLAASFQNAVVGQLVAKLRRALDGGDWEAVALGGGVAANALLRERAGGALRRARRPPQARRRPSSAPTTPR